MYSYYTFYNRSAKTNKARKPVDSVTYSVEDVWGAAAFAQRQNSGYFKVDQFDVTQPGGMPTKRANKFLMNVALQHMTGITDEDRAMGRDALSFISQQLTMKSLKGNLSEFDQTMAKIVGMETFLNTDRYEIAIVASQIRAYEQAVKDQANLDRVDRSAGYLGDVGAKVQATVEVTKAVYSQNYNVYFVSGITNTNQAVFFSYREALAIGSQIQVKGSVKAHRPDATQLSRVRVA
jgi:hypothetical protein